MTPFKYSHLLHSSLVARSFFSAIREQSFYCRCFLPPRAAQPSGRNLFPHAILPFAFVSFSTSESLSPQAKR